MYKEISGVTRFPVFSDIFGKAGLVLDELFESDRDLTRPEIANNTGLSGRFVFDFVEKLLELGLIIKTRSIGKADFYQLNQSHPFIRKLLEYEAEKLRFLDEQVQEEKVAEAI